MTKQELLQLATTADVSNEILALAARRLHHGIKPDGAEYRRIWQLANEEGESLMKWLELMAPEKATRAQARSFSGKTHSQQQALVASTKQADDACLRIIERKRALIRICQFILS